MFSRYLFFISNYIRSYFMVYFVNYKNNPRKLTILLTFSRNISTFSIDNVNMLAVNRIFFVIYVH